jgi:hypothetical protein
VEIDLDEQQAVEEDQVGGAIKSYNSTSWGRVAPARKAGAARVVVSCWLQ